MKHVREPLPDVQRRRPEISASLAAVVERATAKETQNRYPGRRARWCTTSRRCSRSRPRAPGQATGEATTVLQSLSGDTADFAPIRLRRPRRALAFTLLVLALLAATAVFLAARTEKGTGGPVVPKKPARADRGAARRQRRERLRPGGRQQGVAGRRAQRDRRQPRHELEHRDLPGRLRGQQQVRRRASTWTPARSSAGAALTLATATPGFKAAVYGVRDRPGEPARLDAAEPGRDAWSRTTRSGSATRGRRLPLLPALDQRAARGRQGARSRSSRCCARARQGVAGSTGSSVSCCLQHADHDHDLRALVHLACRRPGAARSPRRPATGRSPCAPGARASSPAALIAAAGPLLAHADDVRHVDLRRARWRR